MWPLMNNAFTHEDKEALVSFIRGSDQYTNGPKVKEFEQAWSDWLGVRHSLYVSSGSTANFLLLAAVKELYKIPNGSKVLVPACTWVTNVSPVIQLGLEPVFCDIELDTFSFDYTKLPELRDISIVFVTHLLGINAPFDKLKELCPKNTVFLEDICESHGVLGPDGKKRGSESSTASTFSFYYGHHMTTVEGGIVSTNNKELYDLLLLKRSHGMARNLPPDVFKAEAAKYPHLNPQFLFLTDGYNFRNTEFGAVLGIEQLKRLDNSIRIRKENYKLFVAGLDTERFYTPCPDETNSSFCFPLICRNAEDLPKLKEKLDSLKIEHRPIVAGNLLLHPFLEKWRQNFKNADTLNYNGVYVGNNQFVTKDLVTLLLDNI